MAPPSPGALRERGVDVAPGISRQKRNPVSGTRTGRRRGEGWLRRVEFVSGADDKKKFLMRLGEEEPAGELTPVMARLGPADLETLDTLIAAGFAANRAQAVRWALARIRERPAYAQLRDRAREIEELKSQF